MRNSSGRACSACLMSESGSRSSASASADFRPGGGVRGGPGQLPVLDLFGAGPLRLALLLAVAVDERVGQDAEQPRLQVGARLELVERRVRLGERLLDQVLGIRRVPRHPQPGRVELIQVRQHVVLEALAALLECLGYRTHPLGDLPHRPSDSDRMGGRIHPRASARLEARQLGVRLVRGAQSATTTPSATCASPASFRPRTWDACPSGQVRQGRGGEHLRKDCAGIRRGTATPPALDGVMVAAHRQVRPAHSPFSVPAHSRPTGGSSGRWRRLSCRPGCRPGGGSWSISPAPSPAWRPRRPRRATRCFGPAAGHLLAARRGPPRAGSRRAGVRREAAMGGRGLRGVVPGAAAREVAPPGG